MVGTDSIHSTSTRFGGLRQSRRILRRHPTTPMSSNTKPSSKIRLFFFCLFIMFFILSVCYILTFRYYIQSQLHSDEANNSLQQQPYLKEKEEEEGINKNNINLPPQTNNNSKKNSPQHNNNNNNNNNKNEKDVETIGYAISLTGCPSSGGSTFVDGAAVLLHSIHLNSIQNSKSRYDYKMYAIVHPSAMSCTKPLQQLGYELLERDVPVPLEEIEGDFLRERVPNNGCCGEKEFIKIWAYAITDHPIIVHLDLDTVVLQPLDALFDAMLNDSSQEDEEEQKKLLDAMWPDKTLPSKIDAYFTRDYNMVKPTKEHPGVQGGFLVLRPSQSTFDTFVSLIRKGDFRNKTGWGGTGHGTFYGGMTFQGIIPYFYDDLAPGTAVEVNRCVYNQMADNPRDQRTVNDIVHGNCRDGRKDCEDCRDRSVEEVKTAHFTLCQKPWECLGHEQDAIQKRLCRKLHGEWFRIRADLELSWEGKQLVDEEKKRQGKVVVVGDGTHDKEHFRGFCKSGGKFGYIPIEFKD